MATSKKENTKKQKNSKTKPKNNKQEKKQDFSFGTPSPKFAGSMTHGHWNRSSY